MLLSASLVQGLVGCSLSHRHTTFQFQSRRPVIQLSFSKGLAAEREAHRQLAEISCTFINVFGRIDDPKSGDELGGADATRFASAGRCLVAPGCDRIGPACDAAMRLSIIAAVSVGGLLAVTTPAYAQTSLVPGQAPAVPGTSGEAAVSRNGAGPDSRVTGTSEGGRGGAGGSGGILSNGTNDNAGTATGGNAGGRPDGGGGGGS